ncbi:MAG: hypothetical protein RL088_2047 [Verrucomicrobiota bacterium]|jgi:uncharacterized protein (TIGR00251 family)
MARLLLRIVPNARRTEIVGAHGAAVKIKVQSPATDGKANAALLEFLAETLGIPARSTRIVAGEKSRDKLIEFDGLDADTARDRLLSCAEK